MDFIVKETQEVRFMATARMNESWKHIKSQIQTIWSDVDFGDHELKKTRGSLDSLVGLIHEKTGEKRSKILKKMNAII